MMWYRFALQMKSSDRGKERSQEFWGVATEAKCYICNNGTASAERFYRKLCVGGFRVKHYSQDGATDGTLCVVLCAEVVARSVAANPLQL